MPILGVEVTAIPFVTGGKVPEDGFVFSYQWYTADDNLGTNKLEIVGETTANFTPDNDIIGIYFGCAISTTDALGVEASGESFIGPVSALEGPPVIFDVTVSEIEDGIYRYTDKEFPYVTTMALEGTPAPEFELKAKVSGTTFDFSVKSDTIIDVEGGGIDTCETELISNVDIVTENGTTVYSDNPSSDVGDLSTGSVYATGGTADNPSDMQVTVIPEDVIDVTVRVWSSDDKETWSRTGSFNPTAEPTYTLSTTTSKYAWVAF